MNINKDKISKAYYNRQEITSAFFNREQQLEIPSQEIFENFDGFTAFSYGNHTYNDFNVVTGRSADGFALGGIGNAIRLNSHETSTTSILEYEGTDGAGKDGGVGVISFWYSAESAWNHTYQVELNINNAGYNPISGAPLVELVTPSPSDYRLWSFTINNPNDNIKVRVRRILASNGYNTVTVPFPPFSFTTPISQSLFIDDFQITDYSE